MALSTIPFLNGLSELILFVFGFAYFIRFLILSINKKKKMAPLLALVALSLGSMHLGGAVAFLMKVIWAQDLDVIVYGYLTYIHVPFGLTLSAYLGYDLFNPKLKWWMVLVHGVLGVVYLIAMIGWPELMIYGLNDPPAADVLIDVNIRHVALGVTIAYLVSTVLVMGGNFLRLRSKMNESERELKKKSLILGIGWILFGLTGLLCTLNPLNLSIIPNSACMVALILIFIGFEPIKTVEEIAKK